MRALAVVVLLIVVVVDGKQAGDPLVYEMDDR